MHQLANKEKASGEPSRLLLDSLEFQVVQLLPGLGGLGVEVVAGSMLVVG